MTDTIIVGGGLFGQIIAAGLRAAGQDVRVLDNRQPLAGSGPAACLMKPSWFSSLGKEVYEPSLALLDRLYGVRDLPFVVEVGKLGKISSTTVHWCDPAMILSGPTEQWTVTLVEPGQVAVSGPGAARGHDLLEATNVIVAAGIWSNHLLPARYAQQGLRGTSTLLPGHHPPVGKIRAWAPYKQLVGFDRGDGLWVGDGTSIKMENWTDARTREVVDREWRFAREMVDLAPADPRRVLSGIRPYAKGHKPCLLEQVEPGLWVASGGAKNGTLAAGWAAHELIGRLT